MGIGGSVTVNVLNEDTKAWIGRGAQVNASLAGASATGQDIAIEANDDTDIFALAGAAQYGGTGGIGGGVDVGVINKHTYAYIGDGAVVKALDDMTVKASSDETVFSVGANIGAGGFAVALSASVYAVDTQTRAYVEDSGAGHATLGIGGDLTLSATGTADFTQIAGSVAIGTSSAGVGLSNTTLVHNDSVEATIGGGSVVTARGSTGLTLSATSSENLLEVAAAGAGGSTAGVAGSAPVQVLNEHTHAFIGDGARINADAVDALLPTAQASQSVSLSASDTTYILGIGGALGGGGTVGVGAGAEILSLNKDTLAYIGGATVNARGDVVVDAQSSDRLIAVAAAVGAGGTVGVAGSAGVQVLNITTSAFIGDDAGTLTSGTARVVADGNVAIASTETTEIDLISGTVTGAGTVAIGASAAVTVVSKTTEAYIGRNAEVTGKGNNASTVKSGRFGAASYGAVTGSSEFPTLNAEGKVTADLQVTPPELGDGFDDLSSDSDSDTISNPGLTGVRTLAPETRSLRGVSVTATNKDNIDTIGASGGGATVGVNVSGNINVLTSNTNAFVAEGAKVNQDSSGTVNADQEVLVAAANDYHHMAIVATASGGLVGVAANADVTVANINTSAYVDDGALVNAKGVVEVSARSHQDLLSLAFSLGAGFVGVSQPVSVLTLNTSTHAYIGNNATSDAAGAKVDAGGSVLVSATDDTDNFVIVGSVAGGAVGVGGALTVLIVDKDTGASVGDHASVEARGGTLLAGISAGTMDGAGNFDRVGTRGLAVRCRIQRKRLRRLGCGRRRVLRRCGRRGARSR